MQEIQDSRRIIADNEHFVLYVPFFAQTAYSTHITAKRHVASVAGMTNAEINKFCALEKESENMLAAAYERFKLSARAGTRLLKVARTIADLAGAEMLEKAHLAEAIRYRVSDI